MNPHLSPIDPRSSYHGVVIAVAGPPHSGKSVFLAELYRQLLGHQPSGVFLQPACPDGEGMWANESDPQIVRQIRRKFAFSEEFISITLQGIEQLGRNSQKAIVLLDLGGKRSAANAEILRRSTHCMILSSQVDEIPLWELFATTEGCQILAVFHSHLRSISSDEPRSFLQTDILPMRGTLINRPLA